MLSFAATFSQTKVITFPAQAVAWGFFYAQDGALPEVVLPGTSVSLADPGTGVERMGLAVLDPANSQSAIGVTINAPQGTLQPLAMISIQRWSAAGASISGLCI